VWDKWVRNKSGWRLLTGFIGFGIEKSGAVMGTLIDLMGTLIDLMGTLIDLMGTLLDLVVTLINLMGTLINLHVPQKTIDFNSFKIFNITGRHVFHELIYSLFIHLFFHMALYLCK